MFKSRKKDTAKSEPKKSEPKELEVPVTAGAPAIEVRKSWDIGDYRVRLADGHIHIEELYEPYKGLRLARSFCSASFPKKFAAAIADAILQAS